MTTNGQNERYRRILETTRVLFKDELRMKSIEISALLASWRDGSVRDADFVDKLYHFTHTLKGLALTVGFEDVHKIAETASLYKYRNAETPLSNEELDRLASTLEALEKYK